MPHAPSPIVVLTHIPKNAGITIITIMRSIYGLRHCRAVKLTDVRRQRYSEAELKLDLRLYPGLRVIAGHPLRPFVDFGAYEARLRWITMLRDPIPRFYSHYRYHCMRSEVVPTFAAWCAEHGDRVANLQVRWLAGRPDLPRAKELLRDRYTCVGDVGEFDTSLALFSRHLPGDRFPTSADRVDNPTPDIGTGYDPELAARYNDLDLDLYAWFRSEIWPHQLATARAVPARPFHDDAAAKLRRAASLAYHAAVYKNVKRVAAWRERAGPPA